MRIPDAGATVLDEITINAIGRKNLVDLTGETFSQALFKGAENMKGYAIYGTKGLAGNTYNRNIFLLEEVVGFPKNRTVVNSKLLTLNKTVKYENK